MLLCFVLNIILHRPKMIMHFSESWSMRPEGKDRSMKWWDLVSQPLSIEGQVFGFTLGSDEQQISSQLEQFSSFSLSTLSSGEVSSSKEHSSDWWEPGKPLDRVPGVGNLSLDTGSRIGFLPPGPCDSYIFILPLLTILMNTRIIWKSRWNILLGLILRTSDSVVWG